MSKRVLLICGEGTSSWIVYNFLTKNFGPIDIIIEGHVPIKRFLRTRIKKLGLFSVISQVAFMAAINPILKRSAAERLKEIAAENSFDLTPSTDSVRVESINSSVAIKEIRNAAPDVIVVNGTRIISRDVLACTQATFINTHAGITPAYRGSHGGYWALYEGKPEHCGVTVHVVDSGIDTGGIIGQAVIAPTEKDNFATYPMLQLAAALPILKEAVARALDGTLTIQRTSGPSGVWYHPTIFQYLSGRLRGIR